MSNPVTSILFNGKFLLKLPAATPRLVLSLHRIDGIQWDSMIKGWWVPAESIFDIAATIESEASAAAHRLRTHARFEEVRARASNYRTVIAASCATDSLISIPAPTGLTYLGYQKAGIQFAKDKKQCLIADEMGLGKAQPLSAKVLTPSGWSTMGDMKVGTPIVGADGGTYHVTGVFPQGCKAVHKVTFSDNSGTECCEDHLWSISTLNRRGRGNPDLIMPLKDIRHRIRDGAGNRKWFIPIVQPVTFERSSELPLDPYLMGVLLAEGGLTHSVRVSLPESRMVQAVTGCLPKGVCLRPVSAIDYTIAQRDGDRTVGGNSVRNVLKDLGLMGTKSKNKFIPSAFKMTTVENRLVLLQGIMDGGGECSLSSTVSFTTASDRLFEDVKFIIESLGGVVLNPRQKMAKIGKQVYGPYWHFTFRLPRPMRPFLHSTKAEVYAPTGKYAPCRSIEKVEYVGDKECQCISVSAPDRLYVTDDFIVTHNTIQALGLINIVAEDIQKPPQTLIIVPVIVKTNWYREAAKWLVKKCPVLVVDGKTNPAIIPSHKVVIINYDILHKFQDALTDIDWDILIGDEAHKIKNEKAQRSTSFREISYFAERRILMTGTPIMNRPSELWHLLHIIDPTMWDNFFEFARRYCNAKMGHFGWDTSGVSNAPELQRILRETCMVRRLKKDVLKELPPKRRQVVEISGTGFEKILKAEQAILQKHKKEYEKALAAIDTAHNAIVYTDAGLENEEEYKDAVKGLQGGAVASLAEIAKIRKETAMAKLPKVIDFIKDVLETKSKVVVMAHHRDVVDGIVKAFGKHAVKVQGGQSPAERQVSVDRFRKDPNVQVFVGSIQAAGVGITLVESDTVIFAELVWTPAELTQAEDRCHRIGQEDVVTIFHLVVEGSIDAYMAKKLVAKQEVIDRVINIEHI